MSFEQVITVVSRWLVATEALGAVGAELSVGQGAVPGHPDVVEALRAVSAAAGLPDLAELPPSQREMMLGLIRLGLRQAAELVDDADRSPGWTFTDRVILDGWGRGSAMVPGAIAAAAPELAGIRSLLDVGTGVGLLAIAAARVWPQTTIVGIDVWAPSLEAAAANVKEAGLQDRIALRDQDVRALDDVDAYDCAWVPTFFLTEAVLAAAMPRVFRAVRPGGWIVLGRMAPPPEPLAEAVTSLRIIRAGGAEYGAARLAGLLDHAGCAEVRTLPHPGPGPMEYIVGRRPVG